MKLYIKAGCPWCVDAERWLQDRGVDYEVVNVLADSEAYREMIQISGQTLTPTLQVEGQVLADFGTPELESFAKRLNLVP